jgi:hypothetical protein
MVADVATEISPLTEGTPLAGEALVVGRLALIVEMPEDGFDTLTQVGCSPLADYCDQAAAVAPFQA